MTKLLFFAGSARADSANKKLARAAYIMAVQAGADATFVDLADYRMPIYDGDLEDVEGLPEKARELKELMIGHDGFFIAAPEYNSSIAPLLKNALDWVSRVSGEGEASLIAYRGKVAAIAAASPGGLGGLRGLVALRSMLGNIGVHVVPAQHAVSGAYDAFDDEGGLKEEVQRDALRNVVKQFIETTEKLRD